MNCWGVLDIERTDDIGLIRRAYARLLKQHNPEDDPEGFQRLRQAYDAAVQWAETAAARAEFVPTSAPASAPVDASESEPQRDGRERQFSALIAPVLDALASGDEETALQLLTAAAADPRSVDFEWREAFERRLAAGLSAHTMSAEFLDRVAQLFQWDAFVDFGSAGGMILSDRLAEMQDGKAFLQDVKEQAANWGSDVVFERRGIAAALLTGPYRPRLFCFAALDWKIFSAMRDMISGLQTFYAMEPPRDLDPQTVGWWQDYMNRPRGRTNRVLRAVLTSYMTLAALLTVLLFFLGQSARENFGWVVGCLVAISLYDVWAILIPAIGLTVGRIRSMQRRWIYLFCLAVVAASLAQTFNSNEMARIIGALATFFVLMALCGERDFKKFLVGAFAMFFLLLAGKRFGPVPAVGDNLLFLYGAVIVFSVVKLWRLYEDRKSASIDP